MSVTKKYAIAISPELIVLRINTNILNENKNFFTNFKQYKM